MPAWLFRYQGALALVVSAFGIGVLAGIMAGPLPAGPSGPTARLFWAGAQAQASGGRPRAADRFADGAAYASPTPAAPGLDALHAAAEPTLSGVPAARGTSPTYNFALQAHGASAAEGQRQELLLDGNAKGYDGANGFAFTEWNATPAQAFVVTLKETTPLNAVRLLLWDGDQRFYRFRLDGSPDAEGGRWSVLADRSGDACECRSWQNLSFPVQSVRRLRLTGTYNSANSGFQVVELEAYYVPKGLARPWDDVEF